jgi:hypothetical protein
MIFSNSVFRYLSDDDNTVVRPTTGDDDDDLFAVSIDFDPEMVETRIRIESQSTLTIQVDNILFINVNVSLNTTVKGESADPEISGSQ